VCLFVWEEVCFFFSFLLFCHGLIICETCHVKGFFFLEKIVVCERLKFVVIVI
jgi:hypothetical protein